MSRSIGYVRHAAQSPLAALEFDRAELGSQDVRIDIEFCEACHCDVHQARDAFHAPLATNYPCMPGHEIAGVVDEVGTEVTKYIDQINQAFDDMVAKQVRFRYVIDNSTLTGS